jgi:hypothetical protein
MFLIIDLVCDSVVAKQNFSRRHGHAMQSSSIRSENVSNGVEVFSGLAEDGKVYHNSNMSIHRMSEAELTSFLEWMQDSENIFP